VAIRKLRYEKLLSPHGEPRSACDAAARFTKILSDTERPFGIGASLAGAGSESFREGLCSCMSKRASMA
jgi:hypothetical protein